MNQYYVYMLASERNGTLYIGMTNDLHRRVSEHKAKVIDGFTKEHGVNMLVWYVETSNAESAIIREKQLKKWKREWKIKLIEEKNYEWQDLYYELYMQVRTWI